MFQSIGEMVILVFLSTICGIVNELSCLRRASAPLSAVASTSRPLGFRQFGAEAVENQLISYIFKILFQAKSDDRFAGCTGLEIFSRFIL